MSAADSVTTTTTANGDVAHVGVGQAITASTYQQMLNILDELVTHTHVFYDDYTTACNCNCNCDCTRGIL